MHWYDVPAGVKNVAEQRFWIALGDYVNTTAYRINTDPGFVEKLVRFAVFHDLQPSASQKMARDIMGKNYFGVEDAVAHFGVMPSSAQLAALKNIPFLKQTLETCKDTHVLVARFPLSIVEIAKALPDMHDLFQYQTWYDNCSFIQERGYGGFARWHLVQKTAVRDSAYGTFEQQMTMLDVHSYVPSAAALVYTIIGHYKVTGKRLFENCYVGCADTVESSELSRLSTYNLRTKRGVYLGNFVVS